MTQEEKIFELLKYCNNEAVKYSKLENIEGDFMRHSKEWLMVKMKIASAKKEAYTDVIKYWESLNKK
jgi:hypothetical protein